MKSKSIMNTKNLKVIFLIPLLIVVPYICMVRYSEYLAKQERAIGTCLHKEKIWVENIRKIIVSDSYREKVQDCFRCSLIGGYLSSRDNTICVVESFCGCSGAEICDCPGPMRYSMEKLQELHPEVSRLGREDIEKCFH